MKFLCAKPDANGDAIPGSGCGELTSVEFDGYPFGDRMLEDVVFIAELDEEGNISDVRSKDDWDTDGYLQGLNKEHWLKLAREFAKNMDGATCPKCEDDVYVYA